MSTAMQLIEIYPDARIALLEKETGPACHQTGHNSGVIHAGVYYTPAASRRSFASPATAPPKRLRAETASAMTSAANAGRHLAAGDGADARPVGSHRRQRPAARVAKRRGATRARTEHYRARRDLRPFQRHRQLPRRGGGDGEDLRIKGGTIVYDAEVSALKEHASGVVIRTRQGGEYEASTLIACSGLMADRLVKMLGVDPGFIICPFRGEYFQLAPQH